MRAPNLILMAALGAVALGLTATTVATAKAPSGPPKACFYARNVRGFSAPTEDTVYLRVSGRDVYEAKLFADCTDIDWAQHIALRSRGSSWICEGSGALGVDVISPSVMGRQSCPVTSLRRLSDDEVAALPRKSRP